ncbi:MAG: LysM peptidoglycan-binding domain-containing protein [Limisphaerales bacterium]
MKKILILTLLVAFSNATVFAQDAATQQQLDKLSAQIQSLEAVLAAQGKHIDAVEKSVNDLQDKLNQPPANNYASADDLKKLAAQVQEIDKKRQEDNQLILAEIEKLGKISGGSAPTHRLTSPSTSTDNSTSAGPQKGYDYTIAPGDTVTSIAKACRAQGVKVTVEQILKANPGLDPKSLIVGKKIFIPAPQ